MLVATVITAAPSAKAQVQTTGTPGSPSATTTIDGKYVPPPPRTVRRRHQPRRHELDTLLAAAVVPPKGAPNILLIMTDDAGFGAPSTFGGVIPTPALDRIAESRTALHAVPLHGALLADAGGADHQAATITRSASASSPSRRPGYPGYNSVITQGHGDHRHDPQGQWLRNLLVRQEPQHAGLPDQPGRPIRPMADGHGLRILLRLHRRRHRPVAAEPVPQHHARSIPISASPTTI